MRKPNRFWLDEVADGVVVLGWRRSSEFSVRELAALIGHEEGQTRRRLHYFAHCYSAVAPVGESDSWVANTPGLARYGKNERNLPCADACPYGCHGEFER